MILGIPIIEYGPETLVGILVLLIATGQLIPRWTHKERVRDKDELIEKLQGALDKRDEQFDKLYTQGVLMLKLLEDIKAASRSQESRQPT